jgi:hypothetical protein
MHAREGGRQIEVRRASATTLGGRSWYARCVPVETVLLARVLSKLIGLGISAWTAHGKEGPGADDAAAVQSLIDAGVAVAGLGKGDGNQKIGALHFVRVTREFGEALKRHWYGDEHLAPGSGW